MKFYCLFGNLYEGVQMRLEHIKSACQKLNVEFIPLCSLVVDSTKLPLLNKDDLLYNVARGSETLETLLLNKDVTTFYINNPESIIDNSDTTRHSLVMQKNHISAPKTIYGNSYNRNLIKDYVSYLDGFPIIVKIKGGTLGIGTLIASNIGALYSLIDFINSLNVEFILREFIQPKEIARLIVIGQKVVISNQKFIPDDDFRSSVKFKAPVEKKYDKEIEKLAVSASIASNFETSGVDIIID